MRLVHITSTKRALADGRTLNGRRWARYGKSETNLNTLHIAAVGPVFVAWTTRGRR